MSKNTYSKKKKYTTRLEKNKKKYYKSNISSVQKNKDKKQIIIMILIISIVLNSIFLLVIHNKNNSLDELNNTIVKDEEELNTLKNNYTNYVFLGDSITEYYDLEKYFPDIPIVNSGVAGDTTSDILDDMKGRVYDYNPSKVFILIGTNDLSRDKTNEEIFSNIKEIINKIRTTKKSTEIYVESIYPVNREMSDAVGSRENSDIEEINTMLEEYCNDEDIIYINTYNELLDDDGNLKEEYSTDGLHLSDEGYEIVTETLKEYLQ